MRTFSATLESPHTCDCCGSSLAPHALGVSRGGFRLEFTEGAEFDFGKGVRVSTSGGMLIVSLRSRRYTNRQWSLRPNYNSEAFARPRTQSWLDESDSQYFWQKFSFALPVYKPWFATWWAELQFVETQAGKTSLSGQPVECHNAASFKVKLETLG